jgi:hypothetical protein
MSATAPNAPQAGPELDPVRHDDLRQLATTTDATCVTVQLPTARHGAETRQGPLRLRNLLTEARSTLADEHPDVDATALLAPLDALVDDHDFWQHQADGLALFAWPGGDRRFRVPLALAEAVHVGAAFCLRPLLPLVSVGGQFHLLALSQNQVRVFEGTGAGLVELDPGPIPTSIEEALAHEDPERQLQVRSGSGAAGAGQFHGHGGGGEVDKATVERFLRAVDHGLNELVGASPLPLVLAGVGYYGPIYRSVTTRRTLVDEMVEGNPEHVLPADLHARAWPIVAPTLAADLDQRRERLGAALGTGLGVTDPTEAADRAAEGRIDTLLVADDLGTDADPATVAAVDRAVAGALGTSAEVLSAPRDDLPGGGLLAALLRY